MKESVPRIAARAHTNANIFAAIASIIEGGCVHPIGLASQTAQQILRLCRAEQKRQLHTYDFAMERIPK